MHVRRGRERCVQGAAAPAPSLAFSETTAAKAMTRLCSALDSHHAKELEPSLLDRVKHRYGISAGESHTGPACRPGTNRATPHQSTATRDAVTSRAPAGKLQHPHTSPHSPARAIRLTTLTAKRAAKRAAKPVRRQAAVSTVRMQYQTSVQAQTCNRGPMSQPRPAFDSSTRATSLSTSTCRSKSARRHLQEAAHQALVGDLLRRVDATSSTSATACALPRHQHACSGQVRNHFMQSIALPALTRPPVAGLRCTAASKLRDHTARDVLCGQMCCINELAQS